MVTIFFSVCIYWGMGVSAYAPRLGFISVSNGGYIRGCCKDSTLQKNSLPLLNFKCVIQKPQ